MESKYEHIVSNMRTNLGTAPVAQSVKRWPTDLAVLGSSPARGELFPTVNGAPLHTAFRYHQPIALIELKMLNRP